MTAKCMEDCYFVIWPATCFCHRSKLSISYDSYIWISNISIHLPYSIIYYKYTHFPMLPMFSTFLHHSSTTHLPHLRRLISWRRHRHFSSFAMSSTPNIKLTYFNIRVSHAPSTFSFSHLSNDSMPQPVPYTRTTISLQPCH